MPFTRLIAAAAIVLATACRATPGALSPTDFRRAVAGTDWDLVELRGQPAPLGAGGRRATVRFDADSARISGFAGCNRYFGSYVLGENEPALSFGPIGMTRMACSQGMDLETRLGEAFGQVSRYALQDGRLAFLAGPDTVAVFRRPTQ